MYGKWQDCWKNVQTGEEVYSKGDMSFSDNQIQNTFSIMMAEMTISLPDNEFSGIYLALGHGDESWDEYTLEKPYSQSTLFDEFYRVMISSEIRSGVSGSYSTQSSFYYIDPDTYAVSGTPTNAIAAKVFIPEGVADGIHREFGMFGGAGVSAITDSGYMINWITFPKFDKTGYELTRTVRLIFRKR